MKKILTTTVITALLATSGFAQNGGDGSSSSEPVGKFLFGNVDFKYGADTDDTTIMPSGHVEIGGSAYPEEAVIASNWELKEGSIMNVTSKGFILTKEIKINPNAAGAAPIQCNLNNDGKLYYAYHDSSRDWKRVYKLVGSTEENYVLSDGVTPAEAIAYPLIQMMSEDITGVPCRDANADAAVINMCYNTTKEGGPGLEGCISGGTATYAIQGSAIVSEDSTDLGKTSLKDLTGKKLILAKAQADGFQESYITSMPALQCGDNTWNFSAPDQETVANSDTLQEYLNSFGFYPKTVDICNKTSLEVLAQQTADDAILIPHDIFDINQDGSGTTYEIKTNLHNVGEGGLTNLSFCTTSTNNTPYTLVFSGDNSNLTTDNAVNYTDMNVTFCNEKSWIGNQTGKTVTFRGNNVVDIKDNMSICSDVRLTNGANLKVSDNKTVCFFGNVTFDN